MAKDNLFFPVGSKVFEKTAKMQYSDYLDASGRAASFEINLISPYIVRVATKERDLSDQKNAAMDHLEKNLIKFMIPFVSPEKKRKSINLRKFFCKVPGCTYRAQLTLIGHVSQFKDPLYTITNVHAWFLIEFRKGIDEHLKLANTDNIQDAFKLIPGILCNHVIDRNNIEQKVK